jgi:hypothetical protein
VQYCKLSQIFSTTCPDRISFSFQSVKLNSTCNEVTNFGTEIKDEKFLGAQNAELSELNREE